MDKIRIGAIVNGTKIPAWHYKLLESTLNMDSVEVAAVVILTPPVTPPKTWGNYLLNQWKKFDSRRLKPNANAPKKLSDLGDLSFINITPQQQQMAFSFKEEDCQKLQALHLDIILNLNDYFPMGGILESSAGGVWHYYHGDYQNQRGVMPGYHEVVTKAASSGTYLLRLNNSPKEHQVLYKSYSFVVAGSLTRILQNSQWKAVLFVIRKLEECHKLGLEQFQSKVDKDNSKLDFYYKPPTANRSNNAWLVTWLQLKRTLLKKIREKFIQESWIILYNQGETPGTDFSQYQKIIPPKDRFWADPFIFFKDNKHYVFVEEVILKKKKGHISVLEIDEQGNYQPPKKVLDRPYHLSYPFMIEWQGDIYMMPESSANKTIEVYKCISFPDKWEFHKNLMEGLQAADATLFYHEDRWWIFTNLRAFTGYPNWDELHLFYADEPLSSTWTPHPANPVISDVRRARPAGKIFEWNGTIYRPSQNCSHRYGYGLKFNEIIKLTTTEYQEREVTSVDPLWEKDIKTVHTFNFEKGLSVIDAKLKRAK